MYTYSNANLEALSVHFIGDDDNNSAYTDSPVTLNSRELTEQLCTFLLSSFKDFQEYRFFHETDLRYNEVFAFCSNIFDDPSGFHNDSVAIAKHLAASSSHPGIKTGELFVGHFTQILLAEQATDAIVLVKSESKKNFLTIESSGRRGDIKTYKGLDPQKVDKAVIIFNVNRDEGFKIYKVDTIGKGADALYWTDDFLKLREATNGFTFTKNIMSVAKEFIVNTMPDQFEVTKADQVDYLKRTVEYFKNNDTFNKKEFESEVFYHPEVVQSFKRFEKAYSNDHGTGIDDEFEISSQVVKRQARHFRSVIKLDKNFHIYVHGNKELIERGYDEEKGMSYYKVYFKEEQ
jgi:hypothetical protein